MRLKAFTISYTNSIKRGFLGPFWIFLYVMSRRAFDPSPFLVFNIALYKFSAPLTFHPLSTYPVYTQSICVLCKIQNKTTTKNNYHKKDDIVSLLKKLFLFCLTKLFFYTFTHYFLFFFIMKNNLKLYALFILFFI
jgi:hypothetical protein